MRKIEQAFRPVCIIDSEAHMYPSYANRCGKGHLYHTYESPCTVVNALIFLYGPIISEYRELVRITQIKKKIMFKSNVSEAHLCLVTYHTNMH